MKLDSAIWRSWLNRNSTDKANNILTTVDLTTEDIKDCIDYIHLIDIPANMAIGQIVGTAVGSAAWSIGEEDLRSSRFYWWNSRYL